MLTRRQFMLASAGLAAVRKEGRVVSGPTGTTKTITLSGVAVAPGQYLELPFRVPAGVNRIDVSVTKPGGDAVTGAGLFDERGSGYQSAGFRGIYGEERSEFFVAAHAASQSFVPGVIRRGTWTVIVPVFRVTVPTNVTATVVLTFGRQQPAAGFGPEPGVVVDRAG
ncbi:MAG: hypothetical protein WCB04_02360, partial [Mycobacteriales bacterium]